MIDLLPLAVHDDFLEAESVDQEPDHRTGVPRLQGRPDLWCWRVSSTHASDCAPVPPGRLGRFGTTADLAAGWAGSRPVRGTPWPDGPGRSIRTQRPRRPARQG